MISLAIDFDVEARAIDAIVKVECSGSGFENNGDLKIQFEPHEFKKRTGFVIANGVEGQRKEWDAYFEAKKLNWNEALNSTSWGMGQIMGYNHLAAGYASVADMINDFKTSEYAQVKAMLTFIKNKKLITAIKNKRWNVFARIYNGPLYVKFKYDTRIESAYINSKL